MHFFKYQGAGNDFILFDNRTGSVQLDPHTIEKLCDRRFGIGADGLMLLNKHPTLDFEMKYFNADGHPGSLCGNGSRCLIRFAYDIGIQKSNYHFLASDGEHQANILSGGDISLHMKNVEEIKRIDDFFFLNTGSPHVVKFVTDLNTLNVYDVGRTLRYDSRFAPGGANVNFVERAAAPGVITVRTYERGVEEETFSCGTGVTACALALAYIDESCRETRIQTRGGDLSVRYQTQDFNRFEDIWLTGPAKKVFEGEI